MPADDVTQRIINVMIRELELSLKPEEIRNAHRLDEVFGMDSIAMTELIIGIEKEFAISIPAEDLSAEIFGDLRTLAEYVQMRLLQESSPESARKNSSLW